MSNKKIINIAKDFSRYPYGRSKEYSKTSGQAFRDILVKALRQHDVVQVILDGTEGYGSSFLDEAFAGLVRYEGFTKDDVFKKLNFISKEDPSLIEEIKLYINEIKVS